jgi:ribonuclease D
LIAGYGQELLALVAEADVPAMRSKVESLLVDYDPDRARLAKVRAAVKECAARLGIDSTVLATRRDIAALAVGLEPRSVLPGWRARELESLL